MAHDCALRVQLEEYEEFHRSQRSNASALHLVYTCHELMPIAGSHSRSQQRIPCLGIGDRFRLIAYLLRVAIATRRVLLVDWSSPAPIEHFFLPARIDWRVTNSDRVNFESEPVHRWLGGLKAEPPRKRYLRIVGNTQWFDEIRLGSESKSAAVEHKYSCLWQFLFKP